MCYNISLVTKDETTLQRALGATYPKKLGQLKLWFTASAFTHPQWPVITANHPHEFQLFDWGLVPKWTPNIELAKQFKVNNLNAKAETIFEKRSFCEPIQSQRCLVPVTGFFEWRELNKKKYPYFIHLTDEDIFCLGGIYDTWVDKDSGEILHTFSVVTTAANPLMAKIHHQKLRMPLILPKHKTKEWLDPHLSEKAILALMTPFDEAFMNAYTIGKRITSKLENPNTPETLVPVHYPELALLDMFY